MAVQFNNNLFPGVAQNHEMMGTMNHRPVSLFVNGIGALGGIATTLWSRMKMPAILEGTYTHVSRAIGFEADFISGTAIISAVPLYLPTIALCCGAALAVTAFLGFANAAFFPKAEQETVNLNNHRFSILKQLAQGCAGLVTSGYGIRSLPATFVSHGAYYFTSRISTATMLPPIAIMCLGSALAAIKVFEVIKALATPFVPATQHHIPQIPSLSQHRHANRNLGKIFFNTIASLAGVGTALLGMTSLPGAPAYFGNRNLWSEIYTLRVTLAVSQMLLPHTLVAIGVSLAAAGAICALSACLSQ